MLLLTKGTLMARPDHPWCGCRTHCGDLEETHDHPDAVCKELARGPQTAPVEIVLVPERSDRMAERHPDAEEPMDYSPIGTAHAEAMLRRERDCLKAALEEIADGPDRHDAVRSIKIAKRALGHRASPRTLPDRKDTDG
jgi:hypothetical protein